jgi:DNA polymerase III subunit delta
MKVVRGAIGSAVDRPDPAIRFYLFHGVDEAGSRSLAQRLLKGLEAEKHGLSSQSLKGDSALLADEASAISMFGGRRLLWIEPAGEEICAAVEALLEAPVVEHSTVAIAGVLRKTSALLKLADSNPAAVSQVSYLPDAQQADRLVLELARANGIRMSSRTASRIAASAGNNQAVIGQELIKFALYLDASPSNPRELDEDVLDLLGADAQEGDAGLPVDLALSGNLPALGTELERLESTGIDPIPVVRAMQRRLLMLVPLRARIEGGQALDAVVAALFWKDKPLVSRMLSRWSSERLAQAIDRVAKLERLILSSAGDRAALGQELIQIARAAGH